MLVFGEVLKKNHRKLKDVKWNMNKISSKFEGSTYKKSLREIWGICEKLGTQNFREVWKWYSWEKFGRYVKSTYEILKWKVENLIKNFKKSCTSEKFEKNQRKHLRETWSKFEVILGKIYKVLL